MANMKYVDVAFCFDKNIARYSCVAIKSLLNSFSKEEFHYRIHCITVSGVKEIINDYLCQLLEQYDSESIIKFYVVDEGLFQNGFEIRNITNAAYFRFLLPELLPDIDKIIYLDVDVIVCDELRTLAQCDMRDAWILGVKTSFNLKDLWEQQKQRAYFDEIEKCHKRYICSGVMLMDLQKLRESNIPEKWKALSPRKYLYQDQDIINITCFEKIDFLPLRYNVCSSHGDSLWEQLVEEKIFSEEEVKNAKDAPAIIHYAGKKPWNTLVFTRSKSAEVWWKYVIGDPILTDWFQTELTNCINNTAAEHSKNIEKIQLLTRFINTDNLGFLIADKLQKLGSTDVAVYGMDEIGKYVYRCLKEYGINVRYGIDQSRWREKYEIKIYEPYAELPHVDVIVVTVVHAYEQIKEVFKNRNISIVSLVDLL